ncbi:MAG TPA: tetratricopeptide repeat protein [Rhizomicrobium sp.]|jgi:predicted O-linked N-acetylglucosamine transferase (SPINDLY family)
MAVTGKVAAIFFSGFRRWELNAGAAWTRVVSGVTPMDRMDLQTLCNQAAGCHQSGRLEDAARLYRQVISADPRNFFAHHMLGILRAQQGQPAEALELIGAAIRIDPNSAEALSNYGNLLTMLGRTAEALAAFDRALAVGPRYAETLTNRANILWGMKRLDEALSGYREALGLKPELLEALVGSANALRALHRPQEALEAFDRALALRPDGAALLRERGALFQALHQSEQALADLDRALAAEPRHAEALSNRGIVLSHLRRFDEALASYVCALAINPRLVEALSNRGHTLREMGRMEEALASYDQALAIEPGHASARNGRGLALAALGRFEEAQACHEQVLASGARISSALADAANMALTRCDWAKAAKFGADIHARLGEPGLAVPPLLGLYYDWRQADLTRCAQARVEAMPDVPVLPAGAAKAHERLRIAYMSSDFRRHPVGAALVELFERHDRSRFEIFAASLGADDGSDIRRRIIGAVDHFIELAFLDDRAAAERLRSLEIDILVDLNGHTFGARPQVLRHQPAPIQASYLGFPGTMGADFIDYIIADATVLPFDQQLFYREKIVQLPDTYWVSDTRRPIGACPSRQAEMLPELPSGSVGNGFVFCCFSHSRKITAGLFDVWMRLLQSVPGSVLWLKQSPAMANLRVAAEARGVAASRLVFAGDVPLDVHLARHALADLFLDTLPYNAHATAGDALWAGLPVLTCLGRTFAGRVAASQLHALGLDDLVAENMEGYENMALRLAHDPGRLSAFRTRLAEARATQPLFNTDLFRRNLEAAYLQMWKQRDAGPSGFRVGEA